MSNQAHKLQFPWWQNKDLPRSNRMDDSIFLEENKYIDFSSAVIRDKAKSLFDGIDDDIEKSKIAYGFVRDEIPHTFDIQSDIVTARASEVLTYNTGICHAKANLLAAFLRSQNIPVGFCFQHLTLSNDNSLGYCVHCYNAIFVDNKWIKVDARGNTKGKNASFSLTEPRLAFANRSNYGEYFWEGIYSKPHLDTMIMLEKASSLQDIIDNIPAYVHDAPDIIV